MVTLKQGKFYKDGEPMPLEFGNKEQIKLLDKVEEMRTEGILAYMDEGDESVESKYETFALSHTCVCGHTWKDKFLYSIEWSKAKFTCTCGFKYVLDFEDYSPMVIVKLLKP